MTGIRFGDLRRAHEFVWRRSYGGNGWARKDDLGGIAHDVSVRRPACPQPGLGVVPTGKRASVDMLDMLSREMRAKTL